MSRYSGIKSRKVDLQEMSRLKCSLRQYLVQMKQICWDCLFRVLSEAWRPGTHAELSGREIPMMEDGAWRGGGEEVSKLVNPMISCCSCLSLHQAPCTSKGWKCDCRRYKGQRWCYKERVRALQRTIAGVTMDEWTSAGASKDECRRYKG